MGRDAKPVVIAIHGVGDAQPGDVIRSMSKAFGASCQESAYRVDEWDYQKIVFDENTMFPELYEVNWSDIQRPSKSVPCVVLHLLKLGFGLPEVRFDWLEKPAKSYLARAYSLLNQCVLAWILYPVLLVLIHACYHHRPALAVLLEFVGILAAVGAYTVLRKLTTLLKVSGALFLFALVLLWAALWVWPGSFAEIARWSTRFYGGTQIVATLLIAVLALELFIGIRRGRWEKWPALCQLACCYASLMILAILGACIWATVVNLIARPEFSLDPTGVQAYKHWEAAFLGNLGYDLALVEIVFAVVTGLIALLVGFGAVCYLLAPEAQRGPAAHSWVGVVLTTTPILLALPTIALLGTSPYFGKVLDVSIGWDVLAIYTASALRIAPWLIYLIPPIAVTLDVIGDVALYIVPPRIDAISTRDACQNRFGQILDTFGTRPLVIVGHSQGTKIAYDVLRETTLAKGPISFLSLGSPIGTLYGKYLGWPIETLAITDWINLYRQGDYIGGAIQDGPAQLETGAVNVRDEPIGPGGHTNYWPEEKVIERLKGQLRLANERAASISPFKGESHVC